MDRINAAKIIAVIVGLAGLTVMLGRLFKIDLLKPAARKKAEAEMNAYHHELTVVNERLREKMNMLQERDQRLYDAGMELEAQKAVIESEKDRLEVILERIGEGLIVINEDRDIDLINDRAKEILGYTRESGIPESYKKFFLLQLWKEMHENKTAIVRKEVILQRPREAILMVTMAHLHTGRSKEGFVVVLRDVTLERHIEKMKSDFVANVSHEIRSPMAPMKDALSLVLDGTAGPITEAQKRFLTILDENMNRLSRLIDDFLDLSKIESGGIELKREDVDINVLVKDTVELIRAFAVRKGISFSVRSTGSPLVTHCDKDRVTQVIINLATNAVKFTPNGGSVRVEAALDVGRGIPHAYSDGDSVLVSVSDTGPGMAPEEAKELFNRYKQLASPEKIKGTGLGLAISRAIIEMHGGKIWVESQAGKGSTFKFTLPIT